MHNLRLALCTLTLAMTLGTAHSITAKPESTPSQPNILFFLTDDQRNDTLGCAGHPIVKTPTIDKLAAQGVRFSNSFCEAPICASSRATLFTGLSRRTHGFNFGTPPVPGKYGDTSYPMLLKAAGYRIGFAGKYGMRFEKGHDIQWDAKTPLRGHPYLKKQKDGSLRHETELCGDAAISFIESNPADTPFCMVVAFNASHAADDDHRPGHHFQWMASTDGMYEDIDIYRPHLDDPKYREALPPFLMEDGLSRGRYFWRWDTNEKYQTNMRAYFRMLTGIDLTIARVLKTLKDKGQADNTIIIYSADNGYLMGDRGMAGKWNHYEQSLRVPLIIHDPRSKKSSRGKTLDELVSNIDIAATIVDAAGITPPNHYQGASLMSFVAGKKVRDWRTDIFTEHAFSRYPDWDAVRNDRYKYAEYYDEKDGPYEILFDLKKDPTELTNLAANPEYARVLDAMKSRMTDFRKNYQKPVYKKKAK